MPQMFENERGGSCGSQLKTLDIILINTKILVGPFCDNSYQYRDSTQVLQCILIEMN